jgi:hypothetical protein
VCERGSRVVVLVLRCRNECCFERHQKTRATTRLFVSWLINCLNSLIVKFSNYLGRLLFSTKLYSIMSSDSEESSSSSSGSPGLTGGSSFSSSSSGGHSGFPKTNFHPQPGTLGNVSNGPRINGAF